MTKDDIIYYCIRAITFPLQFLSYRTIRTLGNIFGLLAFYTLTNYRKRTLSNLALAKDLQLSPQKRIRVAKGSFQNLAINCLEYAKIAREKDLSRLVQCENPETAKALFDRGVGIIFFCGHQANWDVLFLDGNTRMRGVAIGKPIQNKMLYRWILSIREKNGGKIIDPRNALREGLRALKRGTFLGIVGDQGMPNSNYSFPFFGRRAWTSTAPALLAYKTGSPILFATTKRTPTGYKTHYSDPIWPCLEQSIETEVPRLMDAALTLLQESVRISPDEWLWQHNRWKQHTPQTLYKPFRHDSVCIVLPENPQALLPHLATLKTIYAKSFLFLFAPASLQGTPLIEVDEIFYYHTLAETLRPDHRFKLLFNFTDYTPLNTHYQHLSCFKTLTLATLHTLAKPHLPQNWDGNLSDLVKRALCRPGSLWEKNAS